MRVMQVIASIAQEASGPSYSVVRLCQSLADMAHDVRLNSLGNAESGALGNITHATFGQDCAFLPALGRLRLSSDLREALQEEAGGADIIHSHGLWLMPNVYAGAAAARHDKPLVVSPRGMLSPAALQYSPHAKRLFWMVLQGRAVRVATCLHATSEQEYRDIRRFGLKQAVAIVPNGIDIPPAAPAPGTGPRTLLYLGRLHPIKGVDNLLRAWLRLAGRHPDWRLRLVGPDEGGHRARLERLARELALERVTLAGPRYGADKRAEYAAAELYVLPSHTENFGMSVAEALAAAVPVVTTSQTPWQQVEAEGCGWIVNPDAAALETALGQALARDRDVLAAMGRRGRAWMQRDFAWPRIAAEMVHVYCWLLHGGAAPACVRLD